MLNAVIVDDEEKNRAGLEKMIDQFCTNVKVVGVAGSVEEAMEVISEMDPDIVFLDIEMPGGNGFQLLEEIENPRFNVIFTTAHAAYALKAIKFAALDYLLKPISLSELRTAVDKAEKNIKDGIDTEAENSKRFDVLRSNSSADNKAKFSKIALPTIDGMDFYQIDEIIRCEADRAYCNFYLTDGSKVIVSKSMKEFETLLEECNFFRVHKSHMINLNHIQKYIKGKGGQVIMDDGSFVDVSVRRKDDLMKHLARYKS